MLRLGAEEGVCNAQVMEGAQLQLSLSVFIHDQGRRATSRDLHLLWH